MMVDQSVLLQALGIPSEAYFGQWRSLGSRESSDLDHKLRAVGWNFFFMAEELKAVVPAWGGQKTIGRGLKRLLARTRRQHFNCMEVSHVLKKHFLGIPYLSIAAHARHMQEGNTLLTSEQRADDSAAVARLHSA